MADPSADGVGEKVWACQGSKPTQEYVEQRGNITTCLKIKPGVDSDVPNPKPFRALCLLGMEDLELPPVYCYQDAEMALDSYYFWWSPCTKCGTAWRLFLDRDDSQSYYKLPTSSADSSELPGEEGLLGWSYDDR